MSQIIAGKSIGEFSIGMPYDKLLSYLPKQFEMRQVHQATLIEFDVYRLWIDEASQTVKQITVGEGYNGKFLNSIGIGSIFGDAVKLAGDYFEELEAYQLINYPGICFELGDTQSDDTWHEMEAPIKFISIYVINN